MFWKKEKKAEKPGNKDVAEVKAKSKTKPDTPVGIITGKVEQLDAGGSLGFLLPKDFGDWQLTVELNPNYPQKGKKYLTSREDLVDGAPSGKKHPYFDTNNAQEIAEWVIDRKAQLK